MAHQLKIDFEGKNLEIAADRDLMLQIHSVRKTVTVAGNIRLDTEHDDKHHADMFWALALARHAAFGGRTAAQSFEVDGGGGLKAALDALLDEHRDAIEAQTMGAAYEAVALARRRGEDI
jgi:phage FluMu gp28-like protein